MRDGGRRLNSDTAGDTRPVAQAPSIVRAQAVIEKTVSTSRRPAGRAGPASDSDAEDRTRPHPPRAAEARSGGRGGGRYPLPLSGRRWAGAILSQAAKTSRWPDSRNAFSGVFRRCRGGHLKGQKTAQQGRCLITRAVEVRQIAAMIDALSEAIDLFEGPRVALQIV